MRPPATRKPSACRYSGVLGGCFQAGVVGHCGVPIPQAGGAVSQQDHRQGGPEPEHQADCDGEQDDRSHRHDTGIWPDR